MTRPEKQAVKKFLKPEVDDREVIDDVKPIGYAQALIRAGNEQKRQRIDVSKYRSTAHVVCTSNTCERLFSSAKLNLLVLRKSMVAST